MDSVTASLLSQKNKGKEKATTQKKYSAFPSLKKKSYKKEIIRPK